MMTCRVSADGVSFRHPSHSLAGTVWQDAPAKSGTQASIIHVAHFLIGRAPLPENFNGSGENGLPFGRSAPLVAVYPSYAEKHERDGESAHHAAYGR